MTGTTARSFAKAWIDAFNTHDLDSILAHYSADVQLTPPIYLHFTEGRSDTVKGIGALRDYFGRALQLYPDLRFTLLEAAAGTRSVTIRYHINVGDRIAFECFEGPPHRPASRVLCHYVDQPAL